MADFCAICTDEQGPFVLVEHDGRNVKACRRCTDEHPRSGRYDFGGGSSNAGVFRNNSDGSRRTKVASNR